MSDLIQRVSHPDEVLSAFERAAQASRGAAAPRRHRPRRASHARALRGHGAHPRRADARAARLGGCAEAASRGRPRHAARNRRRRLQRTLRTGCQRRLRARDRRSQRGELQPQRSAPRGHLREPAGSLLVCARQRRSSLALLAGARRRGRAGYAPAFRLGRDASRPRGPRAPRPRRRAAAGVAPCRRRVEMARSQTCSVPRAAPDAASQDTTSVPCGGRAPCSGPVPARGPRSRHMSSCPSRTGSVRSAAGAPLSLSCT